MPLNYNGQDLLEKCLPGVKEAVNKCSAKCEVLIVDNGSTDNSKEFVKKNYPQYKFLTYNENKILASYNEAARQTSAKYILLLNNDIILNENSIEPLYRRICQDKSFFAVSPKINSEKENEKYLRRRLGHFFHGHLAAKPAEDDSPGGCLYFHGGAALINRQKFLDLGGFDPLFFYFEDNDLSFRAWKQGLCCIFEPSAEMFHIGAATTEKVFSGNLDRKRALKEKANNLFILKNITEEKWLTNFKIWTVLKALKMVFNIDSARAWALHQTFINKDQLNSGVSKQTSNNIDDVSLMKKIEDLKLEPLKSDS